MRELNRAPRSAGWKHLAELRSHWISVGEKGVIERYRGIMTPSFNNWLGFHVAAEDFAFQDFPIILATFGLSATECDR